MVSAFIILLILKIFFVKYILPVLFIFCSCSTKDKNIKPSKQVLPITSSAEEIKKDPASANEIMARKQVPVLCYHHIRDPKPGQSETFKSYSVSPVQFADQMKALKDSGFETILPDQLYDYLVYGAQLPAKPIMITFDDTDLEQFTIGAKEMEKYGFRGVYFLMTISINRPRYMSSEQIKILADSGHAIESHTWDHSMVTKYKDGDWEKQFIQPMRKVEEITGKPAKYFAYPFGLWNEAAIPELKKAGYKMAFILSTSRDSSEPLFTVRRMIVPGQWSVKGMFSAMNKTFSNR